jgi:hypothetical protein
MSTYKLITYYPPDHNLSVFNPEVFPTFDPTPISYTNLNSIAATVASNQALVNSNTNQINNFNYFYGTTLPAGQLKYSANYSIAYTGSVVPVGIPYMLIINLNLSTNSSLGGYSIDQVQCWTTVNTTSLFQTWNQSPDNGTNNLQNTVSIQFVFTGVGNGSPIGLQYQIYGANNGLNANGALNINTANAPNYSNDIMMLWL